jgi:hypothetical protein
MSGKEAYENLFFHLNRGASTESGERRKITDFIFEWFFFFIFPVMLLLKGIKLIWRKSCGPCFTAGLDWLRKELARLWKTFYPWMKEKLSNKQRKEIAEDKDGSEYNIYESKDNRESETSDVTGSSATGNDVTGSEKLENDESGIYARGNGIDESNPTAKDSSESHVTTSDISRSDVTGSNLGIYKLTGSHVSGNDIAGSYMSRSGVRGSNDARSSITTSSSEATESCVPESVVTVSYGSESDVTVRDDAESSGSVDSTSRSGIHENNEPLYND